MYISEMNIDNDTYYRIMETQDVRGKKKTVILEDLGSATDLKKRYPGKKPSEVALERLAALQAQAKINRQVLSPQFRCFQQVPMKEPRSFQIGYLILQKYYYRLGIHRACQRISGQRDLTFDLDAILSSLIYTRLLYPLDNRPALTLAQTFFEKPNFAPEDVNRAMAVLAEEVDTIQEEVYESSRKLLQPQDTPLFYDYRRYFLDLDQEFGSRDYVPSKAHRLEPPLYMGLFLTDSGFPLSFSVVTGDPTELAPFFPLEMEILDDFCLGKCVLCADPGLSSAVKRKFDTGGIRVNNASRKLAEEKRRRWQLEMVLDASQPEFATGPAELKQEDRIQAHALTVFLSLLIYKALERDIEIQKLHGKIGMAEVLETLRNMSLFAIGNRGYSPAYTRTPVTDTLHELVGFRTDFEAINKAAMRKILAASKRQ